jgi:hypothetical protein
MYAAFSSRLEFVARNVKSAAVRQEVRADVPGLYARFVKSRHGDGRTAGFGHAVERPVRGSEQNAAVAAPGAAARVRRIAQDAWGSAGDTNGLELAAREESDGTAVGRPERIQSGRGLGARQGLRGE